MFKIVGIFQLAINSLLFLNYYLRKFNMELSKVRLIINLFKIVNTKRMELAKKERTNEKSSNKSFIYKFVEFYLPSFLKSITNIESVFYILGLLFSYLGIFYHNFFYGFMLIEFIARVPVLRNVMYCIYQPRVQILVTLFLFIMFIYFFSLVAIIFFNKEFPNDLDTSNILNCIIRMIDQTFKVKSNFNF